MEQRERELSLLKFRNGTHQLLLATDLAARGIDVPEIQFIIHYHLPIHAEEFTHWRNERLPDFMPTMDEEYLHDREIPEGSQWTTLELSGGRKDKISKGDVAGFFFKEGNVNRNQIGAIEVKAKLRIREA